MASNNTSASVVTPASLDEDGIALIVALMAMMLMMALGIALVLTTTTETQISANYREGTEALYAADAAVERVMDDILTVPDWNDILTGTARSAFIDGAPTGTRASARRHDDRSRQGDQHAGLRQGRQLRRR